MSVCKCTLTSSSVSIHADMAPRKRTTKQRKNNPKSAKLEAFLEDFDSEGEYISLMVETLQNTAVSRDLIFFPFSDQLVVVEGCWT